GAIPPNFAATDANAAVTLMRDGLLAMTIFGDSYFLRFNDQRASRVAGQVASIPVPGTGPEGTVASTKCAFWGMALAPNGNATARRRASPPSRKRSGRDEPSSCERGRLPLLRCHGPR